MLTDDEYIQLLKEHNDPNNLYNPPDFDFKEAISRFRQFSADLKKIVDIDYIEETETEDASFHSALVLPTKEANRLLGLSLDDKSIGGIFWISFSNFGNFVGIRYDDALPDDLLKLITDLLQSHGYLYIPGRILDEDEWWEYFNWI
jgi:hypothetical protein